MPEVKTFDIKKIECLIKNSDPYLQRYIKCLKGVSDGWEDLFHKAMKKLLDSTPNKSEHGEATTLQPNPNHKRNTCF